MGLFSHAHINSSLGFVLRTDIQSSLMTSLTKYLSLIIKPKLLSVID